MKKYSVRFISLLAIAFTFIATLVLTLCLSQTKAYAQTYNSGEAALSTLAVGDVTKSGVTITNDSAFDVYIDGAKNHSA